MLSSRFLLYLVVLVNFVTSSLRFERPVPYLSSSIPLPEIPTSIDPQRDPDYSSWGKDPASVNYIEPESVPRRLPDGVRAKKGRRRGAAIVHSQL